MYIDMYIYIYICREREIERERYIYNSHVYTGQLQVVGTHDTPGARSGLLCALSHMSFKQ